MFWKRPNRSANFIWRSLCKTNLGIQLCVAHSAQAPFRMILDSVICRSSHSYIKSSSHAFGLPSTSTWKRAFLLRIPRMHTDILCSHLITSIVGRIQIVVWNGKCQKCASVGGWEVYADAKFRACAGICGVEGIIESEGERSRDKCMLMNLAVNFSIASRKFIVGDASSGAFPDSIDFSLLDCLRRKIQLSAVLSTGCWCLIKRKVNDDR